MNEDLSQCPLCGEKWIQWDQERDTAKWKCGSWKLGSTHQSQQCRFNCLVRLIADDSWAMTFQTLGQYRSALLKAIKGEKGEDNA